MPPGQPSTCRCGAAERPSSTRPRLPSGSERGEALIPAGAAAGLDRIALRSRACACRYMRGLRMCAGSSPARAARPRRRRAGAGCSWACLGNFVDRAPRQSSQADSAHTTGALTLPFPARGEQPGLGSQTISKRPSPSTARPRAGRPEGGVQEGRGGGGIPPSAEADRVAKTCQVGQRVPGRPSRAGSRSRDSRPPPGLDSANPDGSRPASRRVSAERPAPPMRLR